MLKGNILLILFTGLIATSTVLAQGYGKKRGQGKGMGGNFANTCVQLPAQNVNAKEKAALLYMREEEKLARDVYLTLYEKHELPIFQNIAGSELRHTLAVKALLDKYKIEDPVHSDSVGMFTNPELKKLYSDLVALGSKSLKDALIVGTTIEDLDIYDLNIHLKETDNDDIKCVFDNLKRGSENHMRAFMNQLTRNGGTYKAQYISRQEMDLIINSGRQRGGRGNGRKMTNE